MGTLTGKQIDQTYDGLIKTDDEQPISATPKRLQDGLGNDLPVKVGTAGMVYDGAQDFTNATVTGISTTDTTYTLGVEESVPDGIITLTASDGSPAQEIVLQAQGNISMDTTAIANELNVTVEPYTINSAQDGTDVDITLDRTSAQSNVTLQAGTNITLTNTGNNITIDAAGGTDTNTTYDYGAAGAAGNINLALSGSDGSNDVVTMQAGTNITLTDNGSNTFTIDAAGGGGGSFESPLSPARQVKTTTNNFWNFAMPQDGNNYDGGGLQSNIDLSAGRRYFTQIYSDTAYEFALLFGPDFIGTPFAELWDVWPDTGMPRNLIATTGAWQKQSQGTDKAWWTGKFPTVQTLNYEKYYIAFGTSTNQGPGPDSEMYGAIGPGGYINRLVQINVNQQQPDQNNAIDYVGGGMNDGGNVGGTTYAENYDFSYRIDMFNTILFKQ